MNAQDECGLGKRVLIVDDSVDTVQMMKILLKGEGYQGRTAYNGGEALDAARSFLPEVVLLDLTLPDMSGQDVAAELRKDESTAGALIVAISGYDEQGVPQGFDHLLVKPVDHDALISLLESRAAQIATYGMTGESEARSSMCDEKSMAE